MKLHRRKRLAFDVSAEEVIEKKYRLFAEGDGEGEGSGGGDGEGESDGEGEGSGSGDGEGDGEGDAGAKAKSSNDDSLLKAGEKKSNVVDKDSDVKLFAGKFKTPEEMEEGYKALTKKLTESGKIAPEEYEIELPDGLAFADPENDPELSSFKELAKELNLTNEQFNKLAAFELQRQASNLPDYKAEVEKLGENWEEEVGSLYKYLKANFSEEAVGIFEKVAVTADGVRALQEIQKAAKSVTVPGDSATKQVAKATPEQAEEALAKAREAEKAGKPEAERLRKEAERKFQEAYPED